MKQLSSPSRPPSDLSRSSLQKSKHLCSSQSSSAFGPAPQHRNPPRPLPVSFFLSAGRAKSSSSAATGETFRPFGCGARTVSKQPRLTHGTGAELKRAGRGCGRGGETIRPRSYGWTIRGGGEGGGAKTGGARPGRWVDVRRETRAELGSGCRSGPAAARSPQEPSRTPPAS